MNRVGQWPILGMGCWAIDLTATGEIVGEVAISQPPDHPEPELSWLLLNGREGNGYAFEAGVAAKAYATTIRNVSSLVSYIDPGDFSSQKLAERLGGTRDAEAATSNGDQCLVYRFDVAST